MRYLRPFVLLSFAATLLVLTGAAPKNRIETAKKAPEGLSDPIAALLAKEGQAVVGSTGTLCEVWLLDSIKVKAGFSPTLAVKYPFQPGQLVGVLRVGKDGMFTDFRGQELSAGTYTLRYGQQPQDGNHIGTSELSDFLLAIPAKIDQKTDPLDPSFSLTAKSAKSAGSNHPAIFSLLPSEKDQKAPELIHDESKEFWILNLSTSGKAKEEAVKVPLRMVVIGRSEA